LKAGDEHFDECIKLIKEHHLYQEAVAIYRTRSPQQIKTIKQLFGEYLIEVNERKKERKKTEINNLFSLFNNCRKVHMEMRR
jgi:hypothetical protein